MSTVTARRSPTCTPNMSALFDFKSYRAAWDGAHKTDPPIPLNIDIELASICNLKCPFCFYGEAAWNERMEKTGDDGRRLKRFMDTDMAIALIEEATFLGVPALKFNWRGESTLHPDYTHILSYARGMVAPKSAARPAFLELLVNTNANCKTGAIRGLMMATKVMVSLDSTVPATYAKMRVQGDFGLAIHTCRELIRQGHPNLWIRRVITKDNWDEPFVANLRDLLGPTGYRVAEHFAFDRGDTKHATHDAQYDRVYCGYPSQRIMVASNGDCFPCCVDTDGTMKVGRFDSVLPNLYEIWTDEPMVKLRAELREGKFASDICRRCESWMAYRAPQRDFVQDKEIKP